MSRIAARTLPVLTDAKQNSPPNRLDPATGCSFVDETDHGIKRLGSNANVESFKKMTEKL